MIQLYIKTSKFQRGLLPGIAVQEEDDSTSSECFGTTEAEDKPWLKLQKSGASFSRKCKSVQSILAVHQLNFIPYPSQTSQIQVLHRVPRRTSKKMNGSSPRVAAKSLPL
jgi:hypothetical protein